MSRKIIDPNIFAFTGISETMKQMTRKIGNIDINALREKTKSVPSHLHNQSFNKTMEEASDQE